MNGPRTQGELAHDAPQLQPCRLELLLVAIDEALQHTLAQPEPTYGLAATTYAMAHTEAMAGFEEAARMLYHAGVEAEIAVLRVLRRGRLP